MGYLRIGVMGIACAVVILSGAYVFGAQATFEEEMLRVLKAKGVITEQEYNRLRETAQKEHKSVNEEILAILHKKNIISGEQFASLSRKAQAEAGSTMVAAASPTQPEKPETVTAVRQEGAKQKAEIQQAADDALQRIAKTGTMELPGWVKKVKFSGDLRLRHDTQWRDEESDTYHRNRERFRLRFGAKIDVADDTEVGIRLASGSGFQNTTNQSFDEHGRGKELWIDRAYAKWQPKECFSLVAGKMANPLFTTPLVWDPDVNPEGLAELISYKASDSVEVFANLGQWFVEELNVKDTNSDPTLLAWQIGSTIKSWEKMTVQCALSYYDFLNLDDLEGDAGDLRDDEEFLGYNHRHSQQMILDGDNKLVNEFKCLELGATVSFKDVIPVPFSFFGDYIRNLDADLDDWIEDGLAVVDGDGDVISDPNDLLAYGSDDRDTGWLVGCDLGNKKKKGDWYLKYHYQELEDYAFPAVFVDSDFHGGGTNNEGHYVHGRYFLTDHIYAAATLFFTEREDESKDGKKDEDRVQLDVVIKF